MKENYIFMHHAFLRACDNMAHLLQKAVDFAKEKNMQDSDILSAKLAPDMFDFAKQVQVFTDNAVGAIYRGAQKDKPSLPDTEKTLSELITRVQKAKDLIQQINPQTVEGLESIQIKLPWMPEGMYFDGHTYLGDFVVQNVYFHMVTAYGILRHLGVSIGKADYMGQLDMKKN